MTANVPCSLFGEAMEARAREWHALDAALIHAEATPGGAALRYRLEPPVAEALLRLLEAERRCCPSLSFEATVTLHIEAPEDLASWVAEAFAYRRPAERLPEQELDAAHRQGIEEAVRSHYAAVARRGTGCCGDERCEGEVELAGIGAGAYGAGELDDLPAQVAQTSLGCGNPVVVAELAQGETVLDLGSGAGIDVLLSARRVGPRGKAYGLDTTEEMLRLARAHQADAGVDNAEFLRGTIEAIPLPDRSVDVVVSNCVIGLSADKRSVFAEAFRVLRHGGRLAIADVVAAADPDPTTPEDLASWVACVAGALTPSQYHAGLERAGFSDVLVEEVRPVADGYTSVIVRAVKPAA